MIMEAKWIFTKKGKRKQKHTRTSIQKKLVAFCKIQPVANFWLVVENPTIHNKADQLFAQNKIYFSHQTRYNNSRRS